MRPPSPYAETASARVVSRTTSRIDGGRPRGEAHPVSTASDTSRAPARSRLPAPAVAFGMGTLATEDDPTHIEIGRTLLVRFGRRLRRLGHLLPALPQHVRGSIADGNLRRMHLRAALLIRDLVHERGSAPGRPP